MADKERDVLAELLEEQLAPIKDRQSQQERVRQALEQRARAIIAGYEEEWRALEPEAAERIGTVVQPWLDTFIASGNYERLLVLSRAKNAYTIPLSTSIPYIWPRDLYSELQYKVPPFGHAAETLSNDSTRIDVDEIYDPASWHISVWTAGFSLSSDFYARESGLGGLRIWRQPTEGLGYGWGMSASRYIIPLDTANMEQSIGAIHPEVWIGFANQVASGKTDELVREWVNHVSGPHQRQVISGTSVEANRRAGAVRREYLLGRGLRP